MDILHLEKCCHSQTVILAFQGKYDDKKAVNSLFEECPDTTGFKLIRSKHFYGTKYKAPHQQLLFECVSSN